MESELANIIIGSYTDGKERPSLYLLNSKDHTASSILAATNPSYALYSNGFLYVVEEHENGLILTINDKYELVSRVSTMGNDPCHISVDRSGKYLSVMNYGSGSIFICELDGGKPSKILAFITHEGNSNHPKRQTSPHPHSSVFSFDNKILFVADLGTDIVFFYTFSEGKVIFEKQKSLKMPDTGPRTLSLGTQESKLLFLSCELDNTIRVLAYEKDYLELLSAYKISNNEENFLSQIKYWNSGVYVGLRGDNKIMIFDISAQGKGKLTQRCSFKVGDWPRHFAIAQDGHLIVACQRENRVQKYLMKEQKIYQVSELEIETPSVVVLLI